MGERAVPHVRKFLGQRLRELRKQRGHSQERLGDRSSLSGKFIGEVERGEKSISMDSLYRVANALGVSISELANGLTRQRARRSSHPLVEEILGLLQGRRASDVRRALRLLRALFSKH